jgi:hypothetical protein
MYYNTSSRRYGGRRWKWDEREWAHGKLVMIKKTRLL